MQVEAETSSRLSGVSATRREFLHRLGMAALSSALAVQANADSSDTNISDSLSSAKSQEIPRRRLGKTNVEVSALGVGGHHLGDFEQADDAVHLIQAALDAGIIFLDNCREYYNGEAETILGRGLKGHREKAFLVTKVCTHGRRSHAHAGAILAAPAKAAPAVCSLCCRRPSGVVQIDEKIRYRCRARAARLSFTGEASRLRIHHNHI